MESMQADALRAIALWSSANLLLMLALGLMVSRLRIQLGTGVGTGDDARLERAIRAHGNNAEYVPGALLLLLLAGATGSSPLALHVAGASLLAARILHAIGIQQIDKPGRKILAGHRRQRFRQFFVIVGKKRHYTSQPVPGRRMNWINSGLMDKGANTAMLPRTPLTTARSYWLLSKQW